MMPCYFLVHFLLVKNEKQTCIVEGSTMRCRYNINNLFFVFYFYGSIYVRSQFLYVVQRATPTWIIPAVKLYYMSYFDFDVVVVFLLFTAAVVSFPKMRKRIMAVTLFQ